MQVQQKNQNEKLVLNSPKNFESKVPVEIQTFLLCATPDTWLEYACAHLDILLIDHANCEKKAASTALSLMFRYATHGDICYRMSRLAREELRHYEQVLKIIESREIELQSLKPARYAAGLMQHTVNHEPQRIVELLMIGGIIEARSCERFAQLIPYLEAIKEFDLAKFYGGLLASEARHFQHYLELAKQYSIGTKIENSFEEKLQFFLQKEKELIESSDKEFHFHSGVPTAD